MQIPEFAFLPNNCKVTDGELEAYLFGLMPAQISGSVYDQSIEAMEDHLLICEKCLQRAEVHLDLVRTFKKADRQRKAVSAAPPS